MLRYNCATIAGQGASLCMLVGLLKWETFVAVLVLIYWFPSGSGLVGGGPEV